MKTLIGFEEIEDKIITLRGQKVLLDRDVAALYGAIFISIKHFDLRHNHV